MPPQDIELLHRGSSYLQVGKPSEKIINSLRTGSNLLVRIGAWTGKFTLKGSNAAISKVMAKCQ